jgi:hypothetical protein
VNSATEQPVNQFIIDTTVASHDYCDLGASLDIKTAANSHLVLLQSELDKASFAVSM